MIVTCVHMQVKADFVESFKKATLNNHTESVKEPGNLRFDLLQDATDPGHFMIYEAYESDEAAANHKLTKHYENWRDTVAGWMAEPRKGVKYNIIAPVEKGAW